MPDICFPDDKSSRDMTRSSSCQVKVNRQWGEKPMRTYGSVATCCWMAKSVNFFLKGERIEGRGRR